MTQSMILEAIRCTAYLSSYLAYLPMPVMMGSRSVQVSQQYRPSAVDSRQIDRMYRVIALVYKGTYLILLVKKDWNKALTCNRNPNNLKTKCHDKLVNFKGEMERIVCIWFKWISGYMSQGGVDGKGGLMQIKIKLHVAYWLVTHCF